MKVFDSKIAKQVHKRKHTKSVQSKLDLKRQEDECKKNINEQLEFNYKQRLATEAKLKTAEEQKAS